MSSTPLLAKHRAGGGASANLGADKKSEDCGSPSSASLADHGVFCFEARERFADLESDTEAKNTDRFGSSEISSSPEDSKKKAAPSVGKKLNPDTLADAAAKLSQVLRNPAVGSSEISSSPEDSKKKAAPSVGKNLNADTLADAAAKLSQVLRNPAIVRIGKVFASRARKFAANPNDVSARGRFMEAGRFLSLATKHMPEAEDVQDILLATDAVLEHHFLPASVSTAYDDDNKNKKVEPNLRSLRFQARFFCDLAATSTLADAADAFTRAVEEHAAGKDRGKRAAETGLQKAGMSLFQAANQAPALEANLAKIALKLTNDSGIILLTPDDSTSTAGAALNSLAGLCGSRCLSCEFLSGSCQCCSGCWPSLLKWIRSGPELTLPVHHKRQAELIDKRQVLYGIALGAPVALLTSAASLSIFPSEYAPWIGGASVFIWVAVSAGMLANLYGTTHLELMAAINLSRLGMVCACVLLCVYAFWAFFPSYHYILWLLLASVAVVHGGFYIVSRVRGDDDSLAITQIAEKLESIITRSTTSISEQV